MAAEARAIAVEVVFYALAVPGITVRRAVSVTVAANAASFVVGRLAGASVFGLFG